MRATPIKIIGVVNNKGGVGKTTTSKTLSEYLALQNGLRTLAVDLDPQCNLSARFLPMEPEDDPDGSFQPPLHPQFDPQDPELQGWSGRSSSADIFAIASPGVFPYPTRYDRLDVLPSFGSRLRRAELVRQEEVEAAIVERLRAFLWTAELAELYDVVIIDTPPAKSPVTRSVLRACTHLVMPTSMDALGIEGLYGMLRFFQDESTRRGSGDAPLKLVGVLPNMYRRNTRQSRDVLESLSSPDSPLAPFLLQTPLGLRTAFSEVNYRDQAPESVFELPPSDMARQEAQAACDEIWRRVSTP